MDEHEKSLKLARTESALLAALIAALLDPDMNEIGGPLYSGQGLDLGEAAANRLMEINQLMDGSDGGM